MKDVIQIYKSVYRIKKPDYNTASRQSIGTWKDLVSKTGYLSDEMLILPVEYNNDPALKHADMIIIQDIENFDRFLFEKSLDWSTLPDWFKNSNKNYVLANNLQFKAFSRLSKPWNFEIFEFRKIDNDKIEIWLRYSDLIGSPKRENHKIAELSKGRSIRYKINGKDDFTLTGRKQRTFSELDFVIEFPGNAKEIEFKDPNKIEIKKIIPSTECKLIDERKILN